MFCRCHACQIWRYVLPLLLAAAAAGCCCCCRFECRGQHMRLYTQPIDIKRQTRRYTTWSGTHTYTPPCSMMSGRRMPLYMQRQLCRYTCSGIRAAMHEAATVPLYTQRQLPLHTNGRTAANTPFSIKRDCSTQARCMGGGARPRLYNASADAPRLSHTRCTPCGNGRPHLLW